jgi:hypothetical protein
VGFEHSNVLGAGTHVMVMMPSNHFCCCSGKACCRPPGPWLLVHRCRYSPTARLVHQACGISQLLMQTLKFSSRFWSGVASGHLVAATARRS